MDVKKRSSVEVASGKEAKDGRLAVGPTYRNNISEHGVPSPHPDIFTAWDSFRMSVEKHPGNNMLGYRELLHGKWGPYVWKTYKEVFEDVLAVGSALRACGAQPGARIGIYGANCPQWIVAMEACNAQSLICVPLYDTLGSNAIDFIIEHAKIDYVFVHPNKFGELLNPECTSSRRLKNSLTCTSCTFDETLNDFPVSSVTSTVSFSSLVDVGRDATTWRSIITVEDVRKNVIKPKHEHLTKDRSNPRVAAANQGILWRFVKVNAN